MMRLYIGINPNAIVVIDGLEDVHIDPALLQIISQQKKPWAPIWLNGIEGMESFEDYKKRKGRAIKLIPRGTKSCFGTATRKITGS